MAKKLIDMFRPVYPTPAGLITSVDRDGKPNIITLGEVYNLSIRNPVIVGLGIAPQRYSHQLIKQTGEFVVNLPTSKIAREVDICGSVSGRVMDKFALTGLTPLSAKFVKPPLIAECPVNIECRLLEVLTIGDHDLFLGDVIAVHADEECLDEAGKLDYSKVDAFAFLTGEYWRITTLIGKRSFSQRP